MKAKTRLTLAVAVLAVLLFLLIGFSGVSQQDQRPGHCESEARIAAQPREPGLVVDGQLRSAEADNEKGGALQHEQAVTLRQRCEEGAAPSSSFPPIIVAGLVLVVTVMGILLTHWTSVEERPTKRAYLLPTFPDPATLVVRIINVGESVGRLLGFGVAPGPIWLIGKRWPRLRPLSRLVAVGETEPVEYSRTVEVQDGGLFSVLIRYSDVYGETWEAWRTFKIDDSGKVAAVHDGERKGRRE